MMAHRVPKATWVLPENQAPQDSKETTAPRESQAPRGPLAYPGKRVLLETPEFQVSQDLRAPRATQAMRVPLEKRGLRAHQGQQALRAILDLVV